MIEKFIDDTPHSSIGASSMYRWSACPGSVEMSRMAWPEKDSVYAVEGTIAHDVASYFLENNEWPAPSRYDEMTEKSMEAIKKAVTVYTDYIDNLRLMHFRYQIFIEHGFDMGSVYPGAYGTADCVFYDMGNKVVKVIDYKHGAGLVVEVEDNLQLLYYALGAVTSLKLPFREVELTVVQPRAFHPKGKIRKWRIDVTTLLDFENKLVESAERTKAKNPKFKEGNHCFFCN